MFDKKQYQKNYYHERYHKLKSEHKCVYCTKPLDEPRERTMCAACREKNRAAQRKCYQEKKRQELLSVLRAHRNEE